MEKKPMEMQEWLEKYSGYFQEAHIAREAYNAAIGMLIQLTPKETPQGYVDNNIFALMDRASASGIQWPKITVPTVGLNRKGRLVFALAGHKSSVPGSITVTDGGKYPDNEYYGRLIRQADGKVGFAWDKYIKRTIADKILEIVTSPIEQLTVTGQQTKVCCFCAKTLTHPDSKTVGYGPICAENFGLPWAGMAEAAKQAEIADDLDKDKEG